MKGGYILVDCIGLDLTKGSTPQTVTGLHKKCLDAIASGKEVRASNCTWGTIPVTPISVMLVDFGDYVVATAATLQIWVPENDSVTIVNLVAD